MTLKVDVPADLVRGEVGAACGVYRDGKKVVDLWGGYRDGTTRAEWREYTVVVMFPRPRAPESPDRDSQLYALDRSRRE